MGGVLDDCRLRFVQMWRRPPQNTPDFGGPTDCFEILPKKDPAGVGLYSALYDPPLLFPLGYTPRSFENQRKCTKKALTPLLLDTYTLREPYEHGTDTIRTSTSYGTGVVIITSELRYEGVRTTSGTTARTTNPHSYPGESQLRSAPAPVCLAPRPPGSSKKRT